MTTDIPKTMKRLVVTAPGKDVASCQIEVQHNVPVPVPTASEVLIQVCAAPINPSDYGTWFRCRPEQCPLSMGKEGSGVVVQAGGTVAGLTLPVGSKVGFCALEKKQGSYSEYVTMNALTGAVFSLPDDLDVNDGCSMFINPFTTIGIFDTCRQTNSKALVHTAAASQLGQMMVKLAHSQGIAVINVVRRPEQAQLLKDLGAEHVIVSQGDDWKEELSTKIKDCGATVAFDAVAGDMTGHLLDCLPKRGTVYVYGGLAGRAANIDPMAVIYHQKQVKGFLLTSWIKDGNVVSMLRRMRSAHNMVCSGLKDGWSRSTFKDTSMEQGHADIVKRLDTTITGEKLRILF